MPASLPPRSARRLLASLRRAGAPSRLRALSLALLLAPGLACHHRGGVPLARELRLAPDGGFVVPSRFAENQVFVQLSLGGSEPLWFMLDSGMPVTTVDAALVARLALAPGHEVVVRDAGDRSVDARYHRGGRVRVGAAEVEVPWVVPVAVEPMRRLTGVPLAGFIGYDLLSHFTAEIDYAREIVRLYPAGRYQAPAGAAVLPLTLVARSPYVDVTLSPTARPTPVRLLLDLGANGGLDLFGPRVRASGIADGATSMRRTMVGGLVGGTRAVHAGRLDAVQLGGLVVRRPHAWLAVDSIGTQDRPGRDGRLGGAVLRHFVVAIDYGEQRVVLTPHAPLVAAASDGAGIGAAAVRRLR